MNTKVSVVVPTYNYGCFITQALESALAQTHTPAEVIVIDDGSSDGTAEAVRAFGDRVRYLSQENAGVSAARNLGVAESAGEYIAFLDADDIWQPEKLEKQLAKFAGDEEIGLVHCGMREFNSETGETVAMHLEGSEGWVAEELLLWERPVINGSGSSVMVSRSAFDMVGGFDTRLKNGEDWEFCFRVASKFKIGFVRESLVDYRNHGINATKNIAEMERSTMIAWGKVFAAQDEKISRLRRRSYGNLHKVLAGSYLKSGEYGGFARNLVKSLWFRPSYLGYYLSQLVGRKR